MIDAVIVMLVVCGFLAILLDQRDWHNARHADDEEHDHPPNPADDGRVIVTDIDHLFGRFDPNG